MLREEARKAIVSALLFLAIGSYLYLRFTAPPTPTAPGFELFEPWKTIVNVTITVPFLLAWGFGAFAVLYLMTASRRTPDEASQRMFRLLGYGVFALAAGSWITSMISQIGADFAPNEPRIKAAITIARNYAYMLSPLAGFIFIYLASKMRRAREDRAKQNWPPAVLLISILGALWTAIIFTNESRQVAPAAFGEPSFYINDPLIVLTLITPTLIAWFLGIAAALNFSDLESGGSPADRQAFTRIVHGLLLAVFNSMILNGLLSAGSDRLLSGSFAFLLAIVYAF
ncbi:MAG TPA: hypothetical protein VL283_00280, partial [Candidatus Baltobacteraceae bacterium]|nr:hypothetical protein [Candidatus Baltobacteraceae bacterium]